MLLCGDVVLPSSGAVSALPPPSAGAMVVGDFAVLLGVMEKAVMEAVAVY